MAGVLEEHLKGEREMAADLIAILQKVESRLGAGVYVSGPRRGQPFDRRARRDYERWAANLRAGIAWLEREIAAFEAVRLRPGRLH